MPRIEIRHRTTGAILFTADEESLKVAVQQAAARGAALAGADLRDANLKGLSLRGLDLRDADLRDASCIGTDFTGADLAGALLDGADLLLATLPSQTAALSQPPEPVDEPAVAEAPTEPLSD